MSQFGFSKYLMCHEEIRANGKQEEQTNTKCPAFYYYCIWWDGSAPKSDPVQVTPPAKFNENWPSVELKT